MTSTADIEPIFVVGAGRVGSALARLITARGLQLGGLWTRSAERATTIRFKDKIPCVFGGLPDFVGEARLVILAVSDPAVSSVAGALLDGGVLRNARAVLHCGGARSAAEAMPNLVSSLPLGTFHPLVAMADPDRDPSNLADAYFGVEGSPDAVDAAGQLAQRLGVHWVTLSAEQMTGYHAAAVMASNHAVALWQQASEVMVGAGIDPAHATELLLPLLRSTLDNVANLGPRRALTGPVARGDLATVARHLDHLDRGDLQTAALYRHLTLAAARAVWPEHPDSDEPDERGRAVTHWRALLFGTGERPPTTGR